ncbi:MAG TPA: response regulator transcription factor [Terriglobales bacterium]|nr:response regulator transcription factor [Terriglobales bacterium]
MAQSLFDQFPLNSLHSNADDSREEILPQPDMKAGPFTLLVADDHPVVREGVVSLISRQTDMKVIAEASNGCEAVEKFLACHPNVCLLDLRMPEMDGIEAAIAIREKVQTARVIILTSYQSEEEIYRAWQAGVQGYVLKYAPVAQLTECIRRVCAGSKWIPPGIGAQLAKRVAARELTIRETDVLRAIVAGKNNKQIAVELNISESTVKVHVTHMLEKLQVSGRTAAISAALKRGLVQMS